MSPLRCAKLCAALLVTVACHTTAKSRSDDSDAAASEVAPRFAGGFTPSNAPYGGFGGGDCTPTRAPVVFLHGNARNADNWSETAAGGGPSVLATLRRRGYRDCELFGITYLSPSEQNAPSLNHHQPTKARLIGTFIADVLAYTKAPQVDVVGHSLGVTMGLFTADYLNAWPRIRRFIGISGAMRGLGSCYLVGYANPAATTCGSQNVVVSDIFGFWPDGAAGAANPRLGDGAAGFRHRPAQTPTTRFYSIRAGRHDQIVCADGYDHANCARSSMFADAANVFAQVDVGMDAGDAGQAIDHFRSMTDTGAVTANMLDSDCRGAACCAGYMGPCRL